MTHHSIYWAHDQARLKSFSATSKSGASSIVKIEIEVRDPFRLGMLLQDLEEIRREQDASEHPPARAPKRPKSSQRAIDSQTPLMLTYRKDDVL